jgi:uncharacterized protein YggE
MRSLALLLAVPVVALLAGASGAVGASSAVGQHSIVVSGDGSVSAVPDRAQVSLGVTTNAGTAASALAANAARMTRVIAALKELGVQAGDLRTDLVSLSPQTSPNGARIVGYSASSSVTATVRRLDRIGAAIDAAVAAGANQVSGPNLVRSDQSALYRAALRAAIANAKAKAQTIARASGLHLRRITDVTEGGGQTPEPVARGAVTPSSTPIEPGTQLVEATVTVTSSVS